jgi:hypothetical protein
MHRRRAALSAACRNASGQAVAVWWRGLCVRCTSDCTAYEFHSQPETARVIGSGVSSGNGADRPGRRRNAKAPQREHHHQLPIAASPPSASPPAASSWRRHWSAPSCWQPCPRRLPSVTHRHSSSSPRPSMHRPSLP